MELKTDKEETSGHLHFSHAQGKNRKKVKHSEFLKIPIMHLCLDVMNVDMLILFMILFWQRSYKLLMMPPHETMSMPSFTIWSCCYGKNITLLKQINTQKHPVS